MASHDGNAIRSLDGIRAISVLLVLVSHAGYGHIVPGGLGVTVFFFLSGFLISTLLIREHDYTGKISISNFYIRRGCRLVPPLLITLAITYSLAFAGLLPGGVSLAGFMSLLFYFANYYSIFFNAGDTIPHGIGILWSLAVEEHFYILYPGVLALLLSLKLRRTTIGVMFFITCLIVLAWRVFLLSLPEYVQDRTYLATDTRIDSILFGCILALVCNPALGGSQARMAAGPVPLTLLDWGCVLAGIATLLVTLMVRDVPFRESVRYSLQGLALMPLFYYAVRNAESLPFALLNIRLVAKIGVYSYAIYLIHFVTIEALQANLPALATHRPVLLVVALGISVGYAFIIDRWVDPYFRALRRRFRSVHS
jgi:peptidoglycan/LPS O-acetylase OafA/YrhL